MQALLDYASYAPHGYCLFWQPWLVLLHVGADLLIAVSYFAIPGALLLFLRRRPDIRYRGLVALCAAFILLCGLTHVVSIVTLWIPIYPIEGLLKLMTGMVSALTAVTLFLLIPRLVAIPSPHQLVEANTRLQSEVEAHELTLERLREAQHTLEDKVAARTEELSAANHQLSVMTREAVHRGRNLLMVVSSIARQTARGAKDLTGFLESFLGRVDALADATATVHGSADSIADMGQLVQRQLGPMILTFGDRLRIGGPRLEVDAPAAQQLSLALHELATNSCKHGVLTRAEGTVDLSWTVVEQEGEQRFVLNWQESHAAEVPSSAPAGGFGHVLLLQIVPSMLGGEARTATAGGYGYRLSVPLARLSGGAGPGDAEAGEGDPAPRAAR